MNRGFDEGVGEMELSGLGGLEARFEAVAQRHQLIDFGDNQLLLVERRNGDWQGLGIAEINSLPSHSVVLLACKQLGYRGVKKMPNI